MSETLKSVIVIVSMIGIGVMYTWWILSIYHETERELQTLRNVRAQRALTVTDATRALTRSE